MSRARVTAFRELERSEPEYFRQSAGHGGGRQDRRVRRGFRFCRKPDAAHQRQQTDRTDQLQGRDQRRDHYDGEELTPHLTPTAWRDLPSREAAATG